jgi:hypothetical protein
MTPTKFAELCESIGLVPATLYIPGSRDVCLYQLPVDLENPMKHFSSVMTSYSKSFGYRICLIDENGEKNIGCWLVTDGEIKERAYELQKQIKDLRIKQNLESIKRDFK